MTLIIYTAEHCVPCKEVERLVKEGKFVGEKEVEVIDVETDEGFKKFKKEVMDPSDVETELSVPSAYKSGKRCLIHIDTETDNVFFECPTTTGDPPSSGEG